MLLVKREAERKRYQEWRTAVDDPSRMTKPVDPSDDDEDDNDNDGRLLKKRYLVWFNAVVATVLLPLLAILDFIPGREGIDQGQWLIMCFIPACTFIYRLHECIFHQIRDGERGDEEKLQSFSCLSNVGRGETHRQTDRQRERESTNDMIGEIERGNIK